MRRVLRPYVPAELGEAADWYDERVPGLGRDFIEEVGVALARIDENPRSYQRVHLDIRRAPLRRQPRRRGTLMSPPPAPEARPSIAWGENPRKMGHPHLPNPEGVAGEVRFSGECGHPVALSGLGQVGWLPFPRAFARGFPRTRLRRLQQSEVTAGLARG